MSFFASMESPALGSSFVARVMLSLESLLELVATSFCSIVLRREGTGGFDKGGDETEEEGGNGEEKIFEIGEAFFGGSGGNASFGICGDSTEDGDRGDDN